MTQTLATRAKATHRERRERMQSETRTHESTQPLVPDAPSLHIAWPALLLLASGAASLIYQVLWIKQLTLVVGAEVLAVTTGVSAFFAGLALGGWLFGRLADRQKNPLRVYASLEIGVLILAVGATFGLAHAAQPFATLQDHVGALAWLLPFALVGIPAVLMGGTLPVLMRAVAPLAKHIGRAGGRLYAANTAGAIVGTLVVPFVLIPALGVLGSALAAAALNASAALAALILNRRVHARLLVAASPPSAAPATDRARLAVVLYALAGGIALGYEVVWSQAIVQFISTRSFAFSIVLATYLCGLVLGSALVSRHVDRVRDPWGTFALLIAAAGLVALLQIAFLGEWLLQGQAQVAGAVFAATGNMFAAMCARFALAGLCIVFVPTLLLGAAFPFAVRLGVNGSRVGRDVGVVIAMNTAGGIAGTMLTGLVLMPKLGIVHALGGLALAASVVGLIAVFRGSGARLFARASVLALAACALCAAVFTPSDRLATMLTKARGGDLTFYAESEGGTVAVVAQRSGENRFKRLYIQGVSNSGDAMTSLRYMRLQAMLPLIIHRGTPRSALVIGLGTGITAGALLPYPGLDHRVVAELLPAVVRAAPQFKGNYGVSTDPRVEIRLHDGRRELLRNSQRYDLITLEPPPPSAAGVVNLYSSDFYRLAASRLQPGGLVAQWLPLPTQNEEDTRALIKSFVQVFPYATMWTTELHEMMLVGSMEPIELDVPRISERFGQPGVAEALREVGIASPAALLATWITDRAGLEYYAADAQPVTDNRPGIEYAAWVRRADFPKVLTQLLALRSAPPLQRADNAFLEAMQTERDTLQAFYDAGLAAYRGDRDAWQANVDRVMRDDENNPYYRWFVGAGG
ncbi:fused MFS/spermidine synthase [Caballeronia sp. SBC2]|uniref:fused MFS/spermidine synthase n=1 Tax=Caballeronia sp. SBC2 TaxID=2705547 RepID=UPI0013E0F077|nr:fused MFS/spermidine synthase [Caballeronia sp. SBC2]QIE25324.1 Polyamine aminopropyltransferase [Caballeronia sp. SBC2]